VEGVVTTDGRKGTTRGRDQMGGVGDLPAWLKVGKGTIFLRKRILGKRKNPEKRD